MDRGAVETGTESTDGGGEARDGEVVRAKMATAMPLQTEKQRGKWGFKSTFCRMVQAF